MTIDSLLQTLKRNSAQRFGDDSDITRCFASLVYQTADYLTACRRGAARNERTEHDLGGEWIAFGSSNSAATHFAQACHRTGVRLCRVPVSAPFETLESEIAQAIEMSLAGPPHPIPGPTSAVG